MSCWLHFFWAAFWWFPGTSLLLRSTAPSTGRFWTVCSRNFTINFGFLTTWEEIFLYLPVLFVLHSSLLKWLWLTLRWVSSALYIPSLSIMRSQRWSCCCTNYSEGFSLTTCNRWCVQSVYAHICRDFAFQRKPLNGTQPFYLLQLTSRVGVLEILVTYIIAIREDKIFLPLHDTYSLNWPSNEVVENPNGVWFVFCWCRWNFVGWLWSSRWNSFPDRGLQCGNETAFQSLSQVKAAGPITASR